MSTRSLRPYFTVLERYAIRPFSQEALAKELEDAMGPQQRTILLMQEPEFRTQRGYSIVLYRGANNFGARTIAADPDYVEQRADSIMFVVYGPTYVNYVSLEDLPFMLRNAERRQLTIAIAIGGFRGTRGRVVFQGTEQYELRWNDTEPIAEPLPQQSRSLGQINFLIVPEDRIDWRKLLPDSRVRQLTETGYRMVESTLVAREEFALWDEMTYPERGAEFRSARSNIRNVAAWLEGAHPELTRAQRMEILKNIKQIVKFGVPEWAVLPVQTPQPPRAEYRAYN